MSGPVDYQLADLDQQIAAAHARLAAARQACRRSPNAQRIADVHNAARERDELLDRRLAIQRNCRTQTAS